MTTSERARQSRTALGRIGEWMGRWRERAATVAGLRDCPNEEIARDLGVSVGDLRVLAGKWPGATDLMVRRAAALGLDVSEVGRTQPTVMRDMQRVCSICDSHRVCTHDLDRCPQDPSWRNHCPNADTLDALRQESVGRLGERADLTRADAGPRRP